MSIRKIDTWRNGCLDKHERDASAKEVSINVGDERQSNAATGSTGDAFSGLRKIVDLQSTPLSFRFAAVIAVSAIVLFHVVQLESEVRRINQQLDSRDQMIRGLENKSTEYLSKISELRVKIYELSIGLEHTKLEVRETKRKKLDMHMRLNQRKLEETVTKNQHEQEMVETTNQLNEQCRLEKDQLRDNSKAVTEANNRYIEDLLGEINELRERCRLEEVEYQHRENSKDEQRAQMTRAAVEESLLERRKTEWLIECLRKQGHILDSLTFSGIINAVWKVFERGLGISSDLDNCLKMFSSRFQRQLN